MTALFPLCTLDFNVTFPLFIEHVFELYILLAAAWAGGPLLFPEPVLEAELTKVLSTAFSEVRYTKNFGADTAVKSFGYWLSKPEVIATILSLGRGTCCHSTSVCYSHSYHECSFAFTRTE